MVDVVVLAGFCYLLTFSSIYYNTFSNWMLFVALYFYFYETEYY